MNTPYIIQIVLQIILLAANTAFLATLLWVLWKMHREEQDRRAK
jgi:hypothetical protein